jgi:hypothetical protein
MVESYFSWLKSRCAPVSFSFYAEMELICPLDAAQRHRTHAFPLFSLWSEQKQSAILRRGGNDVGLHTWRIWRMPCTIARVKTTNEQKLNNGSFRVVQLVFAAQKSERFANERAIDKNVRCCGLHAFPCAKTCWFPSIIGIHHLYCTVLLIESACRGGHGTRIQGTLVLLPSGPFS